MSEAKYLRGSDVPHSLDADFTSGAGRQSTRDDAGGRGPPFALYPVISAAEHCGIAEELRDAWTREPRCAECGRNVASVVEAALLVGPYRVTHRAACFVPALLRQHPLLRRLATHDGAKEGGARPFVPNGTAEESNSGRCSPEDFHG